MSADTFDDDNIGLCVNGAVKIAAPVLDFTFRVATKQPSCRRSLL